MGRGIPRAWLIAGGVLLGALVILAIVLAATLGGSEEELTGSAILDEVPLVDGHNDVAYNLKVLMHNQLENFTFDRNLSADPVWSCSSCFTDLQRLRAGRVGAQFWAAYVSCVSQYKDAVEQTMEQIDVIKRLVDKYANDMEFVTTADGITKAFQNKRIGSLIGVEGGHSIDSRLAVLRLMYDVGVRYLTLTHTCNTPWAEASPADNTTGGNLPVATERGLTDFGKTLVLEMNRLGMMVDLSHVSYRTMLDAINITKAPVIFSHSSAYALCNHHRNVRDDVLGMMKENGGIVMVNFYSGFVQCNETVNATIEDVVAHINHVRVQAGVDHVGIGADYDGVERMPAGLEDVSKYPHLFDRLAAARPGEPKWTREDLKKLAGLNLIRVFKQVEKVRDGMALGVRPPYEKLLPIQALGNNNTDCRTDLNNSSSG
ncbi:dipeptidase 1-like [Periplaneta americana]|uniref:dipeptidase 1-like n=1 Tax=Periplaneta americana TaxID=6978 RepID=UPI0037E97FF0